MTLFILPPAIETYSHLQKTSYIFTIVYEIDTHLFLFLQTTRKFAIFKKQKKGEEPLERLLPPNSAPTYSPAPRAVPSARAGLTSLFGMGRGGSPPLWAPFHSSPGDSPPGGCDCHEPGTNERRSRGPYGQLVPLGFAVAGFAPAAYRRRRLRRP